MKFGFALAAWDEAFGPEEHHGDEDDPIEHEAVVREVEAGEAEVVRDDGRLR